MLVSAESDDREQSIRTAERAETGLWMSTSGCMAAVYTRTPLGCKCFDLNRCSIKTFLVPLREIFRPKQNCHSEKIRSDVVEYAHAMTKLCRSLSDVCEEWRRAGRARVGINREQDAQQRIDTLTHVARNDFARHVTVVREEQPEGFNPPVILSTRLGEAIAQ